MKTPLLLLTFFFISSLAYAQEEITAIENNKNIQAKNLIYVESGHAIIALPIVFNYERKLKQWDKSQLAISGGLGILPLYGYAIGKVNMKYLMGSKSHHFETGLGLFFDFEGDIILPDIQLGYRYQKPKGKLMFKVGTGFPQIISAGLGWGF